MIEARRYPRSTIPGMEASLDDQGMWGSVLNISQGGMLLQVPAKEDLPSIGSMRKIRMKLLGKEIPLSVDGEVLRIQNGCIAIKFSKVIDLSRAIAG